MPDNKVNVVSESENSIHSTPVQIPASGQRVPRTAADWVRDLRMSPEVNKTTVGVETDHVTPDLLLAATSKMLNISRGSEDGDPKDSLLFQRFYGPAEYFAEHIQRDGGKVARNLLWKATNKGNLDNMQPNALEPHVSSVFYDSSLAMMIDGSTPFDAIDATAKTTRIGEGGIEDMTSAPDEMRTVQPSYFGFIDPVRCFSEDTEIYTEAGWKNVKDITVQDKLACLVDEKLEYHNPEALHQYDFNGNLLGYRSHEISYLVTAGHRMYIRETGSDGEWKRYHIRSAYDVTDKEFAVCTSLNGPEASVLEEANPYETFAGETVLAPGYSVVKGETYGFYYVPYDGKVYCPTVPGGLVYARREGRKGFWIGNSPERKRVGLDMYMAKHTMKGSDGKLYNKFINARTGKEELVDSVTAAKSVVASSEYLNSPDKYVYAMGGKTGIRIVPKASVDYFLPRADEAYSLAANNVPMLSSDKEMRLLMGCLHPDTTVITQGHDKMVHLRRAKDVTLENTEYMYGVDDTGKNQLFKLRSKVPLFPRSKIFYKVIVSSGRFLITSPEHKWVVARDGKLEKTRADELKPGDSVPRRLFGDLPFGVTSFPDGKMVTPDVAILLGYLVKSVRCSKKGSFVFDVSREHRGNVESALQYLGCHWHKWGSEQEDPEFITLSITNTEANGSFISWLEDTMGKRACSPVVPDEILGAHYLITSYFLDAFTKDSRQCGEDQYGDIWLLDIGSNLLRDSLSIAFSKINTDTVYMDARSGWRERKSLKLVPDSTDRFGDAVLERIEKIVEVPAPPVMIDFDLGDNVYAAGNGIITHNSKYATQAVPLTHREAPLVRSLDEASGEDMATILGRKLGVRQAAMDGTVTAVRRDRIDVVYKDGKKVQIPLYVNFPSNAKGFLQSYPQVKAGQSFKAGDVLATSNYTDDKGVAAMGRNLNVGYLSYKGHTYEDAVVLSESAAKALESTVMYKTAVDLDKTIRTGKKLYTSWKPSAYSSEQMEKLDDNGIVKPGQRLMPGDPMILAVQTTEPSPGTMGKRILTDVSETWDHDDPGVVTDVVKTRNGIKVFATVTAPLRLGDKISGSHGNKGTVSRILPDELMPRGEDGKPLDILLSPLGILSRTNAAQLSEMALGKVARKTGIPVVMPQFTDYNLIDYAKDMLKKYHLKASETVLDPQSGRKIPNVATGTAYFYKLKHLADAKMSARGTAEYTSEGIPAGGGEEGCFRGDQRIVTRDGVMRIDDLCNSKYSGDVLTFDGSDWMYRKVTDWFVYEVHGEKLRTVSMIKEGDPNPVRICVTVNHKMYLEDMTPILAGKLKPGDRLAGLYPVTVSSVYAHCRGKKKIKVYDFTVESTHKYVLEGGILCSNSKRIGQMETAALVGWNAFENLKDAKLIRGQSNADFWRSLRSGEIPVMPGEPTVHKKFFAHLKGSGINVKRTPSGLSVFAMSQRDIDELTRGRELKSRETYESKNFRPIQGGLFGQDVFGPDGDSWGYIQLDEPLPNPVMEEPLARLLNIPASKLEQVAAGKLEVDGMKSGSDIKERLERIDLKAEKEKALHELKTSKGSRKDAALKRYRDIARMERLGVPPSEYMFTKIPVLPPALRPVTTHNGLTMVADSNYLYAQMMDARNDLREAANLPPEYQADARASLYRSWKELTGLYEPENKKLQQKHVTGLLGWALGKSPKWSAFTRKVLGSTVDTVGRGVIIPDSRLKLNQAGIPEKMAWGVFSPFVTRALVQANYTPVEAMKLVKSRNPVAKKVLLRVMEERPILFNRAPTLHKLSIEAYHPVLTAGNAIRINPSIVVPFGADFDGDTVRNSVLIAIKPNEVKRKIRKYENTRLTRWKNMLSVSSDTNLKEDKMIASETRAMYVSATGRLEDLPRVPGTEVRKSDTVTEWDVEDGFYTSTVHPETGEIVMARITKVSKHTGLKMYNCTVESFGCYSRIVTASEDHSLITLNPATLDFEKIKPCDAAGRCVPKVRYNVGNTPEYCLNSMHIGTTVPMGYNLGMFLGILIGDGWIDSENVTRIACAKPSMQKYLLELLTPEKSPIPVRTSSELFSYTAAQGRFGKTDMQRFTVHFKHSSTGKELAELIGKGAASKRIPLECLMGSRAHLTGLLMGLLTTDGSITYGTGGKVKKANSKTIIYHTVSPDLRDGVQDLAIRLGIRTSVTAYRGRNSTMDCYAIVFSLEDFYREYSKNPAMFVLPYEDKNEALHKIMKDMKTVTDKGVSCTMVPFPRILKCEMNFAGVHNMIRDPYIAGINNGYIKRFYAEKVVERLKSIDWKTYRENRNLKKEDLTGHTPEEAERLVNKWISLVENRDLDWGYIKEVSESSVTEGWDCTVPGPYTFVLSDGTVVQDTVNIHAPVSSAAVKEAFDKMLPERNLISLRDHKVLNKPEKEYLQGLYVATRLGDAKGEVKVFDTLTDAQKAYKAGDIDIDTPVVIKQRK